VRYRTENQAHEAHEAVKNPAKNQRVAHAQRKLETVEGWKMDFKITKGIVLYKCDVTSVICLKDKTELMPS
jgi:methyl coenzyme M reductase subunit D